MFHVKIEVYLVCFMYYCYFECVTNVTITMSANNLAKSTKEKDQNDNDLCRKHTIRCDKVDYNRSICPSKLSKRELEDLYYTLMENNLELKRTINTLNEKNRILSTKVQRIAAQTKTYMGKDCCAAGKAVINEQKAALEDLTKANEALADRVRRLNTQLCTAKQFLKQNPNGRYKCYSNTSTSVKNSSTTSLRKSSNVNLKSAASSAIQLHQEPPTTRTAETNTLDIVQENDEKEDEEKVCNENRCRTTMEKFKEKIGDLEEELVKTHTEYSTRMTQLESQVSALQAGGLRARSEREALERARRDLRQADRERAELETRLSIEKKRVAELEMRLKAADLSQQVAQTVEQHLNTACRREEEQLRRTSADRSSFCSNVVNGDVLHQSLAPPTPAKTPSLLTVPDDKMSKSDDSGYADHRHENDIDGKDINQANQELMKKIEELQAQLDTLKSISAEKGNAEIETSPCPKTFDQYYIQSDDDQEIKYNENTLPKHTQISICEPAITPSKELITEKDDLVCERRKVSKNEIDALSKDEYPSKEKYGRNDPDLGVSNIFGENDITDKEQAAAINTCVLCECHEQNTGENDKNCERKKHSVKCATHNFDKENNLISCPSKVNDHDEVTSISLMHVVGSINKKPHEKRFSNDGDNDSETSSTTKRKRVSLVMYDGGTDNHPSNEIGPTSPDTVQKDSTPGTSKVKAHNCNFQQIPGPLPVSNVSTGKRKVSISDPKPDYYENTKIDGQNKDKAIIATKGRLDRGAKNHQDEKNNVSENSNMKDNVSMKKFGAKDVYDDRKNEGLVIEVQYPEDYKTDEENDLFIRNQEKLSLVGTPVKVRSNVMIEYKGAKDILKDGDYRTESYDISKATQINGITTVNEFDICQHHATICTCPEKPSPSLTMFRSCSGSQTLATLPLGGRFRRCSCSEKPARFSCGLKDKPIGTSTPKADRAAPTSPHTYTIDSGNSRADSPVNTDNEISVMTDLPSEKDDTNDILSPGEQRQTATSTDACSLGYGLSEGEVPRSNYYQDRKSSKCLRRTDCEKQINLTLYREAEKSPTEKMEATLRAISEELARCRYLLLSERPTEVKYQLS